MDELMERLTAALTTVDEQTAEAIRLVLDARIQLARLTVQEAAAKRSLDLARACAEVRAIEAAGGEKALGSNQAARDRAFALALAEDEEYRGFLDAYVRAQLTRYAAEAQLEAARLYARALIGQGGNRWNSTNRPWSGEGSGR